MQQKSPTGSLPPAVPFAITPPTFSPWTHTSDDSYIYQLSLVLATATVSFRRSSCLSIGDMQNTFSSRVFLLCYVQYCSISIAVSVLPKQKNRGIPVGARFRISVCRALFRARTAVLAVLVCRHARKQQPTCCASVPTSKINYITQASMYK